MPTPSMPARRPPGRQALKRFIPDIRQRTELQLVGSPLTQERFVRRHRGTYGPGISASNGQVSGAARPGHEMGGRGWARLGGRLGGT